MSLTHSFFINNKEEVFITSLRKKVNPISAQDSISIMPGWVASEHFNFFNSRPPVYKKSVVLKTIPYMVEEYLIEPLDNYHFTIIIDSKNKPIFSYVAAKNKITEWMEMLSSVSISPSALYPDIFALPYEEDTISVFVSKPRCLARTYKYCGFCGKGKLFFELLSEQAKETNKNIKIYTENIDLIPQTIKNKVVENRVSWFDILARIEVPPTYASMLHGKYLPVSSSVKYMSGVKLTATVTLLLFAMILGKDLISLSNYKRNTANINEITKTLYSQMFNQNINDITQLRKKVLLNLQEMSGNKESIDLNLWLRLQEVSNIIKGCSNCNILAFKMHDDSHRLEMIIESRREEPIPKQIFSQRRWQILSWDNIAIKKLPSIPATYRTTIIVEKR